ncbi:MAG: hypothetical protein LKG11_00525 [Bacilli bacterium]|nr:hypothetical protein [Bacilli bacterium]
MISASQEPGSANTRSRNASTSSRLILTDDRLARWPFSWASKSEISLSIPSTLAVRSLASAGLAIKASSAEPFLFSALAISAWMSAVWSTVPLIILPKASVNVSTKSFWSLLSL